MQKDILLKKVEFRLISGILHLYKMKRDDNHSNSLLNTMVIICEKYFLTKQWKADRNASKYV